MADLRRFVLRHIFLVRKRVWVGGQFHEISNDRPGPGLSTETTRNYRKILGIEAFSENFECREQVRRRFPSADGGADEIRTLCEKVSQNAEFTLAQGRCP